MRGPQSLLGRGGASGGVAYDLFKVEFMRFFLEVELFFGELIIQSFDFLKARAFSTAMAICAATVEEFYVFRT